MGRPRSEPGASIREDTASRSTAVLLCACQLFLSLTGVSAKTALGNANTNLITNIIVDVDVVDIGAAGTPFQTSVAVQACAGLRNREPQIAGAAYVIQRGDVDWDWLTAARSEGWVGSVRNVSIAQFVATCLQSPVSKGYMRYNYTQQHLITPQLLTIAGVLDAVPLEDGSPMIGNASVAFDAVVELGFNRTLLNATRFVFDRFVNQTSTMAFMDPGFTQVNGDPFTLNLTNTPDRDLIDFIVKERLFNMYMVEACIEGTADYALMEQIATSNPWPRPIPVFGYDDTVKVLGGDVFEAETSCVKAHNMGQIASDSSTNLAFFSIPGPITEPMKQNPTHVPQFNKSMTYIAITVGDGDNLSYMQTGRRQWMQERQQRCANDSSYLGCFPLLWSASPHMLQQAPTWMRWYYAQARVTQNDYFVLPPSGHLYAYPSQMPPDMQAAFVRQTEDDARLMSTNSAVAWEVALSWQGAIDGYFPRYDEGGVMQSFFAVNVPFMIPVLPFLDGEFFKVLGNHSRVVLFRPREWRGTNPKGAPPLSWAQYLTPQQMADEINGYPPGTVQQIYLTSDGGANLETIYSLVPLLEERVRMVDHEALAAMALASHAEATAAQ